MEKPTNEKLLRLEVNNPFKSSNWPPRFWRFGEDERVPYEKLRKQLNHQINDPVLPRMIPKSDLDSH